ncbi:MAG: DUF1284 domain-containing protein [Lachnospiraceae bacterium]
MKKIYLRPHHLLCTQTFLGKGYSDEFVENMTYITKLLRNNKSQEIELTFSCDSLCSFCPNRTEILHMSCCSDDKKVTGYDQKVTKLFHLEEKTYVYTDLIREIDSRMTLELLKHICGNCSWAGICQKKFPFT